MKKNLASKTHNLLLTNVKTKFGVSFKASKTSSIEPLKLSTR